jgi:multidrug efflux pump subunit AcrB
LSIPKFAVRNPVLANLVMITIIAFGAYAWIVLPRELTPEIKLKSATVTTIYPGASSDEVERLVTAPIEDAIEEDVSDLDIMLSTSAVGRSVIMLQFEDIPERDFDKQMQKLRSAVERVSDLPAELPDDPRVMELDISAGFPMITAVVSGLLPERRMKQIAEALRDDILDIPNIGTVQIAGARERAVWVELDPDRLTAYRMSVGEVIGALRAQNLDLPAGSMDVGATEYIVRTVGQFRSLQDIEATVVRSIPGGGAVKLSDLGTVVDTYEKPRTLARLNGSPSMSLTIQKKKDGNTIRLVEEVRKVVKARRGAMPAGVTLSVVNDYSVILRERLGILQSNAGIGLVLVVFLLFLFIGWRNAVFAALGIPVAFMATFFFMHLTGYTLSGVALFGLILVVGIVVDDAIVVIENVHRHMQSGKSPARAAIEGAEEVGWPVLAASLTTIAAFGPLLFMSGVPGQFMRIVPVVAILVLVASLVEVFFILPAHIAEWGRAHKDTRDVFAGARRWYTSSLKRVLRRRYPFVAVVFTLGAIVCVAAFSLLEKQLFPGEDFPQFYIKVELPTSASLTRTSDVLAELEQHAMALPSGELIAVVTNVGILTPTSGMETMSLRSNVGEVLVELTPKDQRSRSVDDIIRDLRERVGDVAGVDQLSFAKMDGGPPQGQDVEVKVKGARLDELRSLGDMLMAKLATMGGVYDVRSDFTAGKPELRVRVDPERARQYGLDVTQVAYALRAHMDGVTTTTYRDADDAVDVVVKTGAGGVSGESLLDMDVMTPTVGVVPLGAMATVDEDVGYAELRRFEGERAITITASVDRALANAVDVNEELIEAFADIEALYPGYRLDFRGSFDQINESFGNLWKLFIIGILMIYVILGAQFRSFTQPIVIMFAVPFGIVGAMVGLLLIDATLSMVAMFGIVALSGIVVNDSIVLIDFINRYRDRGYSAWRSIMRGGSVRFRPIVLTSVTTIIGLMPMALGLGGKSPIWMPLAVTIIFGLATSTLLTLFMMPALYAILVDIRGFRRAAR